MLYKAYNKPKVLLSPGSNILLYGYVSQTSEPRPILIMKDFRRFHFHNTITILNHISASTSTECGNYIVCIQEPVLNFKTG